MEVAGDKNLLKERRKARQVDDALHLSEGGSQMPEPHILTMKNASRLIRTAGLIIAAALTGPALAAPVNVAGVDMDLPALPGMCSVGAGDSADAAVRKNMAQAAGGSSELLALFMACPELERMRTGATTFQHAGQYLRLTPPGAPKTLTVSREVFVKGVASNTTTTKLKEALAKVMKKLAEAGPDITSLPLGELQVDSDAVYFGTVVHASAGQYTTFVTAITLVRRIPVAINLLAPGVSVSILSELLKQQRANVRALLTANP